MDKIEIVEYDASWPYAFAQEKSILENALRAETILAIEHVGSTAILGLAAKPIIDILIAVPSVSKARDKFVFKLQEIDYVFWADNPNTDKLFFVKGMPPYGEKRTHHIHVVQQISAMHSHIQFRDYLTSNREERNAYASLKRRLATQYADDREAYTDAKTEFIARIIDSTTKT